MKCNEMIYKPLDQVFQELTEERQNLEYFKELDQKWLIQTIQMIVKNPDSYYSII